MLWRDDGARTLGDLPTSLLEYTLAQFGQDAGPGPVRAVLGDEEQRFARLLARGRKVLARFGSGRPLTEADLAYLHQTHGLPPDLVTELLARTDAEMEKPGPLGTKIISLSERSRVHGPVRLTARHGSIDSSWRRSYGREHRKGQGLITLKRDGALPAAVAFKFVGYIGPSWFGLGTAWPIAAAYITCLSSPGSAH